ncbi:MAG: pyrroline-5-carboxylate reductase [Lysobacterales bacterium]|jgi:pyrroline-5-carboxylate reductase
MKISFIGGGNMATALISGIAKSNAAPEWIHISEPNPEARQRLETEFPVKCFADTANATSGADIIVLAVKPQVMHLVLAELAGLINSSQLVISIAAGVTIETIRNSLGSDVAVVRTMPNTPALIGEGISGLFAGPGCSAAQCDSAEKIVSATGASVWVDNEALINVVTAVSGSGPAYFFLLTEALREAGQALGLPEAAASKLAIHTAYGAGAMARRSDVDVAELRRRVTSPGGTTQAALDSFESDQFRQVVMRAVNAARIRGEELSAANDNTVENTQ